MTIDAVAGNIIFLLVLQFAKVVMSGVMAIHTSRGKFGQHAFFVAMRIMTGAACHLAALKTFT